MKSQYVKNFASTIIIAFVLSFLLPWWGVMLAAFISSLIFPIKNWATFIVAFIAIFIFWTLYAFILSASNDFILAKKIAILLPLKGYTSLLFIVTGSIGGISAGFAALLANQLCLLKKR